MSDNENKAATDEALQEAFMNLLEVKLAAFMGRTDLSSSPPEDKVAIRAAYFLGVSAGISIANTTSGPAEEKASNTDEDSHTP